MKLLFQSDDFGLTEGVTLGIIKGIKEGIVRNTGLFVNTDASEFAASFINEYPEACFGLDVNLVSGKPISKPEEVPSLVDEEGNFIKSTERYKNGKIVGKKMNGIAIEFEEEPYNYDEVYLEMENQLNKFIELVGKKPEYIHPHSLVTPATLKAFREISDKYDLKFSMDILGKHDFYNVPSDWNIKPVFKIEDQGNTDVVGNIMKELPEALNHNKSCIICHCGYVDAELLNLSTYSLIRTKDLEMATSDEIISFIKENEVQLITYRDLD